MISALLTGDTLLETRLIISVVLENCVVKRVKYFEECFYGCRGRVTRFPHY